MKKILRLTVTALCIHLNSLAQVPTVEWSHTYGGSNGDLFFDVVSTSNDDLFITANSSSTDGDFSAGDDIDQWICIKTNSLGDTSWIRFFGGSGEDEPYKGISTLDNGFLAVGITTSVDGDVTFNHGLGDLWITKLDSEGNLEWQKTYGGSLYDAGTDAIQLKDSGYIILGRTESNDGDVQSGNHGGEDLWVVRIDKDGNLKWEKTYGGSLLDRSNKIIKTPDNGFAFTGLVTSNDGDVSGHHAFVTSPYNTDIWLVKIDSIGNIQWQKCFGGKFTEFPGDLKNTLDGGFVIAGFTRSENSGNVKNNFGGADFWVVKTNSEGKLKWQRNYGGSLDDVGSSVIPLIGGGYIVGGTTYSNDEQVTNSHGGIGDGWLIRISKSGKLLGSLALGGSDYDGIYSFCKSNNGGIVGAGFSYSIDGDLIENKGFYDGWIVKISPSSLKQMEQGAHLSATIQREDGINAILKPAAQKLNTISVYPNPSFESFHLKLQDLPASVIISDVSGKKIEMISPSSSIVNFGEDYLPGMYFARIIWPDGKMDVIKMMKMKSKDEK